MQHMGKFGHNTRRGAATLVAAVIMSVATPHVAVAAVGQPVVALGSSSSSGFPRLPAVEVPDGVRDAAAVFGISVPKRIDLDPRTNHAKEQAAKVQTRTAVQEGDLEAQVAAQSRAQLISRGHKEDLEAQRIANDWARQAVAGEAVFTGDVGRGTTATTRGTGNIYRLTPAQAAERVAYLTKDERVPALDTQPAAEPKRFGVATARDGETIYLVEYFLNN